MTDLDTTIRAGLGYLVDQTPMVPSWNDVARGHRTHWRRRNRLQIGGGILAGVALVGVPAVAVEVSNPFARAYQPSDVLPARYGINAPLMAIGKPLSQTELLDVFVRREGLRVSPGEYLPTGPLGPLYAEVLGVPVSGSTASTQVVVMTVQAGEAAAVARSASASNRSVQVKVGGHQAQLWRRWSSADSMVVSWSTANDEAVLVATGSVPTSGQPIGSISITAHQLLTIAGQVQLLAHPPMPPRLKNAANGPTVVTGHTWDLSSPPPANGSGVPTTWLFIQVSVPSALSDLFGTLVGRGVLPSGEHWAARSVGDPATGELSVGGIHMQIQNGQADPLFDSGLEVDSTTPLGLDNSVVTGSAPKTVREIRITLSDGSTRLVSTESLNTRWPRRVFATAYRYQSAHVSEVQGLDATGRAVTTATGDLPLNPHVGAVMLSPLPSPLHD